ncbi:MAG: putative lipid II flippase FtsW [Candidatus Andersenbacteria bacterium]
MASSSRQSADTLLLLCIIGLTLFGMMMITSASSVIAERFRGDIYAFLKHQLFFGGSSGLVAFLFGFYVPYRKWRLLALPGLLLSLILLVMVFIPGLQFAYGGAARWISLGPITIQPTEITKLAFIVYLAALLERKKEDIHDFRKSVVPFLIITGIITGLIVMQPDIGTLFSIVAIAGAMVFIAGFKITHLTLIAGAAVALFILLFNTASYRLSRILVYLHPELDPQGIGYQINQALLAVGTGGMWGLGFGRSRQKYHYLPEPAGDSIFAIIAEELGLIRSLFIIAVFLVIAYRGYIIAHRAPDLFGRLLACGITSWISIQVFINIGSILAVTPLTGIPLPFISYGGTSLVSMLFASGILLNISKYARET